LLPLLNAVDSKHGKPAHVCAWIGERLSECRQRCREILGKTFIERAPHFP
jgi:hypothetical protein